MSARAACFLAAALSASAPAATITASDRTLETNAAVTSGANSMSDPKTTGTTAAGVYSNFLGSNASIGASWAFASASQDSDVTPTGITFGAHTDVAGQPAAGESVEGVGSSRLSITLHLDAAESWTMDAESTGFGDAFAAFTLTKGGAPILEFDTRLGASMMHQSVALTAGDYVLEAECRSTLDAVQQGGLWSLDITFVKDAAPACPGDANGDGVVDFLDLNHVLSDFGVTAPGLVGDVDGDGDCDFIDLNIVLSNFGVTC